MAGLQEQQLVRSSQCSKASSACEHFYSLCAIPYNSPSLPTVIYLLPSLCLKRLRKNKGELRAVGEGYPTSLWLSAVRHCMCCGLYFWQAVRHRGFFPAILYSQVLTPPHCEEHSLITGSPLPSFKETSWPIQREFEETPQASLAAGCSAIATWSCS